MRRALTISLATFTLAIGCSSGSDGARPQSPDLCADAGIVAFEPCDAANADPNGPRIDAITGPSCARTTEASAYRISFSPPAARIVGIAVGGQAETGPKDPYESRWSVDTPPANPFAYLFGPTRAGEARLGIQLIDEQNRYGPALCGNVTVR